MVRQVHRSKGVVRRGRGGRTIATMNPSSASLPGFTPINASTEAPLEMLAACHGRVQRQCQTLQRLLPHVAQHGADDAARQAAVAVMRYFDTAAVDHHADEELDLFPALREALAGSDAVCVVALIDALRGEHRQLEALWRALRSQLNALATGDAAALQAQSIDRFIATYERHIEREDTELLPMAARLLDDRALQSIGAAMRERRGIAPV